MAWILKSDSIQVTQNKNGTVRADFELERDNDSKQFVGRSTPNMDPRSVDEQLKSFIREAIRVLNETDEFNNAAGRVDLDALRSIRHDDLTPQQRTPTPDETARREADLAFAAKLRAHRIATAKAALPLDLKTDVDSDPELEKQLERL